MKYKNKKVTIDGITFDSMKEAKRYTELKVLEKASIIDTLGLQRVFLLIPSVTINGRKKPALKYIADFSYMEGDRMFVEDVKSAYTRKLPVYRIKAHLMKYIYNVDIREI